MDYDNFRDTIFALVNAKNDQKIFLMEKCPVSVIEHANEQVAKIRGKALALVKKGDSHIPSIGNLKIVYDKAEQAWEDDKHDEEALGQLQILETIMSVAYPDHKLSELSDYEI